ncbi:MAG: hypothetical protein PVS3B3_16760 [Ktedonobacteraceae bacterium]
MYSCHDDTTKSSTSVQADRMGLFSPKIDDLDKNDAEKMLDTGSAFLYTRHIRL